MNCSEGPFLMTNIRSISLEEKNNINVNLKHKCYIFGQLVVGLVVVGLEQR